MISRWSVDDFFFKFNAPELSFTVTPQTQCNHETQTSTAGEKLPMPEMNAAGDWFHTSAFFFSHACNNTHSLIVLTYIDKCRFDSSLSEAIGKILLKCSQSELSESSSRSKSMQLLFISHRRIFHNRRDSNEESSYQLILKIAQKQSKLPCWAGLGRRWRRVRPCSLVSSSSFA